MTVGELSQLVVFRLDAQRYALPLAGVERIVRAVEVTPLPGAPDIVLGVIDVEGTVLPVLSLRRRFGMPEREVGPADQFLFARFGGRRAALVIDDVEEMVERPELGMTGSDEFVPGLEYVEGTVRLDDGLVLLYDLEKSLSLGEAEALDEALGQAAADA